MKEEIVKFNFHNKLKNLFLYPNKFLNSVEKDSLEVENQKQSIVGSLIGLYLVFFILTLAINLIVNKGQLTILRFVYGLVYSIFLPIIVLVGLSSISYIVVRMLRGKEGFFNTYKSTAYVLMMGICYAFLLFVISYFFPFDFLGLQSALSASSRFGSIISNTLSFLTTNIRSGINALISLVVYLHITIFWVKSIKKFQKFNTFKALIVVLASELVIFVFQVFSILSGLT